MHAYVNGNVVLSTLVTNLIGWRLKLYDIYISLSYFLITGVNKKSIGIIDKIGVELDNILRNPSEAKKNSSKLEDYSPWLSNFSANENELNLEIPGQYDGSKMPLLQYHVKISGFNTNVRFNLKSYTF